MFTNHWLIKSLGVLILPIAILVLMFGWGCNGGINIPTPTPTPSPTPTPTTVPQLYIANFAGNSILSYANPGTVNGNIVPTTNLSGAQTGLNAPPDVVVTSSGLLLACNFGGALKSITSYSNASTAGGNLLPTGNVQGAATQLTTPTSMAIDNAQDLLYVTNNAANNILVFSGASTGAFNGNQAPIRTITSVGNLNNPVGNNLDASDNLYIANNGASNVLVFASASTLNGNVAPTRVLTNAAFLGVFDCVVDSSDRLLVVTNGPGRILIFNNASTKNGAVSPDVTLTVTGAVNLTSIAVDAAGRGYIVDNTGKIFSYDNIVTRNGALSPDRTISGSNTQFAAPIRVFLVE